MKTKDKKMGIFEILKIALPKCLKATPLLFAILLITEGLFSIVSVAFVRIQQWFFDEVTYAIEQQGYIKNVIIALAVFTIVNIVHHILQGVHNVVPLAFQQKATGHITHTLHKKIGEVAPIDFEDSEKLDRMNKATVGAANISKFVTCMVHIFINHMIYFVLMTMYFYSLNPVLAIAILFVFVPLLLSQIIRIKVYDKAEDKSAPIRRKYEYYEQCLVGREYIRETRLLGAFQYFRKLYIESLDKMQYIKYKSATRTGCIDLGLSFLTVLGYGGVLYLLFTSLMDGKISVGAFAAVYSSIGTMYTKMENMMNETIVEMAKNFATIRNYAEFVKEDGKKDSVAILEDKAVEIDVNNVSFKYPMATDKSLYNVDLKINAGETVALVGENGSGKTTLVKLLTGVYAPTEGNILYNGTDIDKYDKSKLFEFTSAVFQKYQKYQMTLFDNINISSSNKKKANEELDVICAEAGVEVGTDNFPNGYDTMLSREYDGVDLSGGQWQRVAIARALCREHQFIVFDEPTSAIDPFEETRIYNEFAKLAKDKTAIIVTHRLGSVKLADRIVVLKKGRVVQVGTHDELVNVDGEYKRLFDSQKQWYAETDA